MCQNSRRRSSSTTDWPTRPVIVTNIRVATAWISTVTANTAAIRSSGPVSPDFSSGGMPLSIAMPTSHGPASAASDATTIAAAVHVDAPPVRAEQVGEQHAAASPQQRRERRGDVVDLSRSRCRATTRRRSYLHLRHRHQGRVGRLGRHQLAVAAGRGDHPAVEQRDPVGERDRGRPVRDDQRRGPGQHVAERAG